jgi:hypothetical protein
MAIDELQQIAEARATMMMRGHHPLRLVVGPAFWRGLASRQPDLAEVQRDIGENVAEVLDMRVSVNPEMEGFAVLGPQERH